MRFIHCLLLVIAFILPLLAAASDQNVRRRTLNDARPDGLQDSLERDQDEDTTRSLTWGWSWNNKKRNKNRKNRGNRYQPNFVNGGVGAIATQDCNCQNQWNTFEFKAFMGNAIDPPTPNVNLLGGQYVYNAQLSRNEALTEPFEDGTAAFVTGTCTRFQNLEITDDGNRILGAGLCQFVVTVVTSDSLSGSMIVQGELFDVIPSEFSITGGTGDFDGARGKVSFTPFYENGGTDVFTEASRVDLDIDARVLDSIL